MYMCIYVYIYIYIYIYIDSPVVAREDEDCVLTKLLLVQNREQSAEGGVDL